MGPWDISLAEFLRSVSVAAKDTAPLALFFKSDGTKMYIGGTQNDDVDEYELSTAWDVTTATWARGFNWGLTSVTPAGIFFKPDGTKMFILDPTFPAVFGFNLGTAWNVTTATWDGGFDPLPSGIGDPLGLFFKPDGTKMYIADNGGDDINEFDLSSPWVQGSASFNQSFSVSSQDATPTGIFFKPDGTKMYMVGTSGSIYEYDLSTAWDISSASYNQSFSVSSQDSSPQDVFFKDDGLKFYVTGITNDSVYEYNIVVPGPPISGVVTLNGSPVEGAIVRCIRQSDNVGIEEQETDSSGEYLFENLNSEELYHLAVEYESGGTKYNAKSLWDIQPYEVE